MSAVEWVLVLVVWGNPVGQSHQVFPSRAACEKASHALVSWADEAEPSVRHKAICVQVDPE
jgi:hypothetical protein